MTYIVAKDSRYIKVPSTKKIDISISKNKKRNKDVISVMFLTWERDHLIKQTVESFREFIRDIENDVKIEYVWVDNGSKNKNIYSIMNQYKWDVKVLNSKNHGIFKGIQYGVKASNGEYFICLEDDWKITSTKPFLNKSIGILNKFKDIGGIRFNTNIQSCLDIDNPTRLTKKHIKYYIDKNLCSKHNLRWRGKNSKRGWYDIRFFDDMKFFTWKNMPNRSMNAYCNGCFLTKSDVLDFTYSQYIKFTKEDLKESGLGRVFGKYYNAGLIIGDNLFKHTGVNARVKGGWHE